MASEKGDGYSATPKDLFFGLGGLNRAKFPAIAALIHRFEGRQSGLLTLFAQVAAVGDRAGKPRPTRDSGNEIFDFILHKILLGVSFHLQDGCQSGSQTPREIVF
jgi:hypothetical protein